MDGPTISKIIITIVLRGGSTVKIATNISQKEKRRKKTKFLNGMMPSVIYGWSWEKVSHHDVRNYDKRLKRSYWR
jgi:hypothetical protein